MCEKKIAPFDMKNIPYVVDVVVPMWSPPVGDSEFRRFDVEYIVRSSIFENDYRFQLDECGRFCAATFFAEKGDLSSVDKWYGENIDRFPEELRKATRMSREYIEWMDGRTFGMMEDDDIKLSLFVSRKKGCGSKLLGSVCEKLRADGKKNLYLWTDCDCDWQWYLRHGFSMVSEAVYDAFSDEIYGNYRTFIFRKKI